MMTDSELADFRTRCLQAASRDFQIALAEMHMADLTEEVGEVELPSDMEEGSASHLFMLASAALEARLAPRSKGKKAAKSIAPPPAKVSAPPPPVKPALKSAPPPAPEPAVAAPAVAPVVVEEPLPEITVSELAAQDLGMPEADLNAPAATPEAAK